MKQANDFYHWLDFSTSELEHIFAGFDQPRYRVQQLWEGYHRNFFSEAPTLSNWPKPFLGTFFQQYQWQWFDKAERYLDPDGTQKWIFSLARDQASIQAVMIPDKDRRTLCISSQVGCAMACKFCATGDQGFSRHLTASEIIGQYLAVNRRLELDADTMLSNIVFMGMGEPLHNYGHLKTAIEWMTQTPGLGLASRRITVSTVGLANPLTRLLQETKVNIALSLHAANPGLRRQIVPAEKGSAADALRDVLVENQSYLAGRKLTIEIALMAGVNDTNEAAKELIHWAKGLDAHVNLIPFNPYPGSRYQRPTKEQTLRFQNTLKRGGLDVYIRRTRGAAVLAACGTLNNTHLDIRAEEVGWQSA